MQEHRIKKQICIVIMDRLHMDGILEIMAKIRSYTIQTTHTNQGCYHGNSKAKTQRCINQLPHLVYIQFIQSAQVKVRLKHRGGIRWRNIEKILINANHFYSAPVCEENTSCDHWTYRKSILNVITKQPHSFLFLL